MGQDVAGLDELGAARKVMDFVVELNAALGIPDNIKDLGVDLDFLPQMVSDSMRSGNVLVNPRLTTASDIETIITNAYHGVH
ncbi:1,3-propanediol dehydrogenase [compost metagenome]